MRLILCLLLLGIAEIGVGEARQYAFNDNCRMAYQAFMSAKVNEGKRLTQLERNANPTNLIPTLLDNYEDYVSLSFNENPAVFEQRLPLQAARLAQLEKGNKASPYHLLCRGLIHLQWSMIRAKNGDNWNAAWDFRRAYLLFVENKKRFPEFPETDIFLGASEAIISTIPSGYQWISELLGLRGDMRTGMQRLNKQVLTRKSAFAEEANLYYIFLKHYLENDIHGAQAYIQLLHLDVKTNWLNCFIAANLAINHKDAATAERLLN
ncbi:MAG: hypothetical protein FGM54_09790, partial [Chitinophagaceae bacterium]|nr:hypothetical protein [Chitinophagaceae bacterium]